MSNIVYPWPTPAASAVESDPPAKFVEGIKDRFTAQLTPSEGHEKVVVTCCRTLAAFEVSFHPRDGRFVQGDEAGFLELGSADEQSVTGEVIDEQVERFRDAEAAGKQKPK